MVPRSTCAVAHPYAQRFAESAAGQRRGEPEQHDDEHARPGVDGKRGPEGSARGLSGCRERARVVRSGLLGNEAGARLLLSPSHLSIARMT